MSSYSSHQRSNCHTLKAKNNERQIKSKYASVIKLPNLILHDVSGFEGNLKPNWNTLPTHSRQKKQTRLQSETHWQMLFCINFPSYLKLTIQMASNSFCYQISWPTAFLGHQKQSQKQRTNLSLPSLQAADIHAWSTCCARDGFKNLSYVRNTLAFENAAVARI